MPHLFLIIKRYKGHNVYMYMNNIFSYIYSERNIAFATEKTGIDMFLGLLIPLK